MNFPNFLKKQTDKTGLEKAKAENLITEKEFLELKIQRMKEDLDALTKKKK
jgi:hypothetical protein